MKRITFIWLCVLAALLAAGCTKDVPVKGSSSVDDAWRYDVSLPVPIQFGAADLNTKAPVESVEDIDGLSFGVFAFDREVTELRADDMLNMRNARAKGVVSQDGEASLKLEADWCYPFLTRRNYSFYSYHVRPFESAVPVVSSKTAYVTIPVGNNTDILYAKAVAEGDGYNSFYLRDGGEMPTFVYEHPTSRISFRAYSDIESNIKIRVDALYIVVSPSATLCIRDVLEPANEGTFVSKATTKTERMVVNNKGTGALNCTLNKTPQSFCEDYYIVPGEKSLLVKVRISYISPGADNILDTGDDTRQTYDTTAELKAGKDAKAVFERNKLYTFILKVNSPTNVQVRLEGIDKYESAFGDGEYDPEDYQ